MKPGAIWFSEKMPEDFRLEAHPTKLTQVDLLLVMGTSMKVQPFNLLPQLVPAHIPQVFVNKTADGVNFGQRTFTESGDDGRLLVIGECDEVVTKLIKQTGWTSEVLNELPDRLSHLIS